MPLKPRTYASLPRKLVEMAGIEPASEHKNQTGYYKLVPS